MCLGVPGKLVKIYEQDGLLTGEVEFAGILKEVCLAYTPEVRIGDYVLMHVGFDLKSPDGRMDRHASGHCRASRTGGKRTHSRYALRRTDATDLLILSEASGSFEYAT